VRNFISNSSVTGLLVAGLLCLACAEIGAPPGGPADTTGPSILATIPVDQAINVPRTDRITIQFSENISRKSVENAIFISPRFSETPKLKWDGKSLNLILPDSFAEAATYVVTIGSTVSDLRNNKMDSSYTFAFSTGERINQGSITGLVMQENQPKANVTIGLYDFAAPDSTTVFDSLYPPYLTQSGTDGSYRLEYLPDGDYFPLAFVDKNKNQRFNPDREAFGLTDRAIAVQEQGPREHINFSMSTFDTATVSIISVTPTSDRLLKVKFSERVIPEVIATHLDRIRLVPQDTSLTAASPAVIRERGEEDVSTLHLWFPSLVDGDYTLEIDNDFLNEKNDSVAFVTSPVFTVITETDQTPPKIDAISHDTRTVFVTDSVISVYFSEPIDSDLAGDSVIRVFDDTGNEYPLRYRRPDALMLEIHVAELLSGVKNLIHVDQSLLADFGSNRAGDSIAQFHFYTYDDDSLGSVSGTVAFAPGIDSTGLVHLTFFNTDLKRNFERAVPGETFNYSFPPGKYLLYGFLDRNGNGSQDPGSLLPLIYSETWMMHPDTIRIRSRFETAGIEFLIK